ncbi:MAG: hypothetical protein VYD19_05260 [Myxococcota bacterium]|nr:hypothetical protein [Myxococcota bacterium]
MIFSLYLTLGLLSLCGEHFLLSFTHTEALTPPLCLAFIAWITLYYDGRLLTLSLVFGLACDLFQHTPLGYHPLCFQVSVLLLSPLAHAFQLSARAKRILLGLATFMSTNLTDFFLELFLVTASVERPLFALGFWLRPILMLLVLELFSQCIALFSPQFHKGQRGLESGGRL